MPRRVLINPITDEDVRSRKAPDTPPRSRRRLHESRTISSWGSSGVQAMPDDRRHHERDLAKDKRTGEIYEVKPMRVLGDRRLTARIASRDKHGKLVNGYSDKIR